MVSHTVLRYWPGQYLSTVWDTIFSFYDNLDISEPTDPEVIIKIDVVNVFNSTDRDLTLDVLSGHVSRDYACDLKTGDVIPTCDNLSTLFDYFKTIRTCEAKLKDTSIGTDRWT